MKRYRERERILTSPPSSSSGCHILLDWTLSLLIFYFLFFFKATWGPFLPSSFLGCCFCRLLGRTDGRSDMGGEQVFCSASLSDVFSLFSLSDIIREASHFYSSCIFVFLVLSAAWRDDLSPLFFYLFFLCASPTDFCVIMADRRAKKNKKKHLRKERGMNDQSY